jgi:acyl carrier protein
VDIGFTNDIIASTYEIVALCPANLARRAVGSATHLIWNLDFLGKLIMEMPPKLKEYIDNNRGSLPPITDPDEPLQIDSLGLIRLVAFLESELGYQVEDEELIAENFATLRALGELLATKTPTAPTREVKRPVEEGIPTFSAKRER